MKRSTVVGFDRFLQRQWLDQALELAISRPDANQARDLLDRLLERHIDGRVSRRETARRLTFIWIAPRTHLTALRDTALDLYTTGTSPASSLPLHWGMIMATYPFVGAVNEAVGHALLRGSGVATAQIVRTVQRTYGDRPTVRRATERVIQSLVDWSILERADDDTTITAAPRRHLQDGALIAWLLEAALYARQTRSSFLAPLLDWHAFFPFDITLLDERTVDAHGRLTLQRQGISNDVLLLDR